MYIVAVSGVVMSVMVLVNPSYFKPNASHTVVYQFYSLLLLLSALTFVSVRHWLTFLGEWQLAVWILPGVVGTVGIVWASRRWGR